MATALAVMAIAADVWMADYVPQPIFFAMMVAFVGFMVPNDATPHARRMTLLKILPSFFILPFIAAALNGHLLANTLVLLVLMFVSFYVRRYGIGATELGLSAVLAYYFSTLFGATPSTAPWFALAALVGIASVWFWYFFVRPWEPLHLLTRSIDVYKRSAADAAQDLLDWIASPAAPDPFAARFAHLRASRRVVEAQFPGVKGRDQWTAEDLRTLRLQLFAIEHDLGWIHEAVKSLTGAGAQRTAGPDDSMPGAPPGEAIESLRRALVTLQDVLRATPPSAAGSSEPAFHGAAASEMASWEHAVAQVQVSAAHIEETVRAMDDMDSNRPPAESAAAATLAAEKAPVTGTAPAAVSPKPTGLHPTTVLGLQAVIATTLAILIASLLNLDHPNWTYWTAFIVVSGPAGESLRKVSYRIIGIALGSFFGTLLVLLLPDATVLLFGIMIVLLATALYTRVINYAWMVFWITMFVAVTYSMAGTPPVDVLLERPLNTLIGGIVAGLVITTLMPMRTSARISGAMAQFLSALDAYLGALIVRPQAESASPMAADASLAAAAARYVDTALGVHNLLAARAYEGGPWSQAHAQAGLKIDAMKTLDDEMARFAASLANAPSSDLPALRRVHGEIHEIIDALKMELNGKMQGPLAMQSGSPLDSSGPSVTALARIRQSLFSLSDMFRT